MNFTFHSSIKNIGPDKWNRLAPEHYPFTRYEFLAALENAGGTSACCAETGWQPHHLAIYDSDKDPIAIMPMYLKSHSYGEYVFDWAWADAYHRNGLDYYPKLVASIPFTPSTGPRLLTKNLSDKHLSSHNADSPTTNADQLGEIIKSYCLENELESAHVLFSDESLTSALNDNDLLTRESVQFHWFNKTPNGVRYSSFDNFLDSLKARKRKVIKKERKQCKEQGLHIKRLRGDEIDDSLWDCFYQFYRNTYLKRSGHNGYLPKAFFSEVGETMSNYIMMVVAFRDGEPVAAALNFFSNDTLYGRYWGCSEELEFLHYELCYYQGIEFCIEHSLQKFDAGAQGEHKVQRGFVPIKTLSSHWIANSSFRSAIEDFIAREARYNQDYITALSQQLPYKSIQ